MGKSLLMRVPKEFYDLITEEQANMRRRGLEMRQVDITKLFVQKTKKERGGKDFFDWLF